MALSEEEKKMAKAYNIGYLLSTYEPGLLDMIIKRNPQNEFVKAMQIGRDHREFHANIPRRDYTPEFKNGFYNGRTLAENNPELLQRLLNSKRLNKDYISGIKSAKKEFDIGNIQNKIKREQTLPTKELLRDANFQKGFNTGYRLAEGYSSVLKTAEITNDKFTKYIAGIKAGRKQYNYDVSALREKEPIAKLFPNDRAGSKHSTTIDGNVYALNQISNNKLWMMEHQKGFDHSPVPEWLEKKEPQKDNAPKTKGKDKGMDHDL